MPTYKGPPAAASPKLPGPRQVQVRVPENADLARLLHGAGGRHERHLNAMAAAAHPGGGIRGATTYPAGIAGELAALLARARAEGHPGADSLAAVASAFGIREPGPGPEPAPDPAPGPKPAPVRAT